MQDVEQLIVEWARDKGILEQSNPRRQLQKTKEEANELETELIRISTLELTNAPPEQVAAAKECARMELGDLFVTCIILAEMLQTKPSTVECMAYHKISQRTGNIIDGLFVKDGD